MMRMEIFLKKNFLEIGKIVSTHGVKGDVKVEPWCNNAEFLCKFKELYLDDLGMEKITVLFSRVQKNMVIIKIKNIKSMEDAEPLKKRILYINRKDVNLLEGEHFIQDILGLKVFDIDTNLYYGKITDVIKTGANDVYQITDDKNKNYLIPVIKDVICKIDIENNFVKIRPLKGIFDDEN